MVFGIDVSKFQGTIKWQQLADTTEVVFAYARAFHSLIPGDFGDDSYFIANRQGCMATKIAFGAYFFYIAGKDGVEQADHFIDIVGDKPGSLIPMVDVEEGSGAQGWDCSIDARTLNLHNCLERLSSRFGRVLLYTNQDTWHTQFDGTPAFNAYPLWVTDPHASAGEPAHMPAGWTTWTIHQYEAGPFSSIQSGKADRDCLNASDLRGILFQAN